MSVVDGIKEALYSEDGRKQLGEELDKTYELFYYGATKIVEDIGEEFIKPSKYKVLMHLKPQGEETIVRHKKGSNFIIEKYRFRYPYLRDGKRAMYGIWVTPKVKKKEVRGVNTKLYELDIASILWPRNFSYMINRYAKILPKKEERIVQRIKEYFTLPKEILNNLQQKAGRPNKSHLDNFLKEIEEGMVSFVNPLETYLAGKERFKLIIDRLSEEQKKEVVNEILEARKANKELDKWLEENHPNIIEETGRDRVFGDRK